MITFKNVSKRFVGGQFGLSNVSFHLKAGEMSFLTGHSGAGKSTLLRLASHIDKASSGDVIINGESLRSLSSRRTPYLRRTMGLIFQTPMLLDDRSVFDNIALPLVIAGTGTKDIAKRVRAALDLVGLLHKERVLPSRLSGGEQQRIGIARAIVHKPNVLLADEPTGNLDPTLSEEIMALFSKLNHFGVTILIATHDLGLIATLPYRVLTLKEGQLI